MTSRPFSTIENIKAPEQIREKVHARVVALERRARSVRFFGMTALTVASLSALLASCIYAWQSAVSSGFGQYLSLVFSDTTALSFSRDLGLSLLESLPALGIAFVLAFALASVWSVSRLAQSSRFNPELLIA